MLWFIHASSSTLGRWRRVFALAALIAMARGASAAQIISTFDTDQDGWTSSSGGSMTFATTGGNPGGFLRQVDLDNTDMFVSAPAKFLGNQSAFAGGSVSFDGIELDPGPGNYQPYGTVTLRSGATSIQADLVPLGNPTATWSTFSIPLDATTFGTAPNTFASVLGNLTAIEVLTESKVGIVETVGLDNFRLSSPVPEPASAATVVTMLMLGCARSRGRGKSRR
jgi:hypothetical protein